MKTRSAIAERHRAKVIISRLLPLLLLPLIGIVTIVGTAAQSTTGAGEPILGQAAAVAPEGAELFAANCSVCHGETGAGFAEAKLAFPPDHRRCTRCHKSGNPPTMTLKQVEARQHDLFDVGDPPALRGEGAMAAHASPEALRAYVAATMPRYRPGTMTEEEYAAVTDFLLALNGR